MDLASNKSKIVHHDLLKPALVKQDATTTLSHIPEDESNAVENSKVFICPPTNDHHSLPNTCQLDRAQFSANVFNTPQNFLPSQNLPTTASTTTKYGRTSKPPERLGSVKYP